MEAAARTLGISRLFIWDHPDGDMRWAQVSEFHADLVLFMRRHRPDAVITFGEDGLYWHLDHVGVYERTTAAVRSLGVDAPPLYYTTMPRGMMPQFVADLSQWVREGKVTWRETVFEGLDNAPDAFIGLFKGENLGKMLVKLS